MSLGTVDGVRNLYFNTNGGAASVFSAEDLQEGFMVLVLDWIR